MGNIWSDILRVHCFLDDMLLWSVYLQDASSKSVWTQCLAWNDDFIYMSGNLEWRIPQIQRTRGFQRSSCEPRFMGAPTSCCSWNPDNY
nr:hypothetical protein Iba_chr02bCG5490 [Ipomoea batatas]